MNNGKLIIFSAPSGAGKSTIVQHLLEKDYNLEFSISATSRLPRGTEKDGEAYYFLTPEAFRVKIQNDEFLEWEEVYADTYYGTLKSEVERITRQGKNVIFDVDVVGGVNIKKFYGNQALAIFIQPPSVETLKQRLMLRATDSEETIQKRLDKAEYELTFADRFDTIVINDDLQTAKQTAEKILNKFLKA